MVIVITKKRAFSLLFSVKILNDLAFFLLDDCSLLSILMIKYLLDFYFILFFY